MDPRKRMSSVDAEQEGAPNHKELKFTEEEENNEDRYDSEDGEQYVEVEDPRRNSILCGIVPLIYSEKGHKSFYSNHMFTNREETGDEYPLNGVVENGEFYWSKLVEKCPNNKKMKAISKQLRHGDSVHFSDYRLIDTFLVYRLNPKDDPLLIQTWMEYGYGIPVDFSDLPEGFLDKMYEYLYIHIDPEMIWEETYIYRDVTKLIKERKEKPKYVGTTDFDYGEQEVDLKRFPQDYLFIEDHGEYAICLKSDCDIPNGALERAKKRYKERRKRLYSITLLMTKSLFGNILPEEVIELMTSFIV